MCFIHVLLNALDLKSKDAQVGVVIEGAATGLLPELEKSEHPLNKLWEQAKVEQLIAGVCQACAHKMGTLDNAKVQDLVLLNDLAGHPCMANFIADGYQVITF